MLLSASSPFPGPLMLILLVLVHILGVRCGVSWAGNMAPCSGHFWLAIEELLGALWDAGHATFCCSSLGAKACSKYSKWSCNEVIIDFSGSWSPTRTAPWAPWSSSQILRWNLQTPSVTPSLLLKPPNILEDGEPGHLLMACLPEDSTDPLPQCVCPGPTPSPSPFLCVAWTSTFSLKLPEDSNVNECIWETARKSLHFCLMIWEWWQEGVQSLDNSIAHYSLYSWESDWLSLSFWSSY